MERSKERSTDYGIEEMGTSHCGDLLTNHVDNGSQSKPISLKACSKSQVTPSYLRPTKPMLAIGLDSDPIALEAPSIVHHSSSNLE